MATTAFVAHPERPEVADIARQAKAWLEARGHRVLQLWDLPPPGAGGSQGEGGFGDDVDLAVSLGGDGTMLRTVALACAHGTPVLGVNLGRLGYLTEIEPDGLLRALERFLSGDYGVEERITLEVAMERAGADATEQDGRVIVLNEAAMLVAEPGHTIRVAASIAGRPFVTYAADGLLVATPTGSTAYNLSARGPILSPGLRAVVLTPVSPHMLFDRPLVLEPEQWIRLELLGPRAAVLVLDGQNARALGPGDAVVCRVGPCPGATRHLRATRLLLDPASQVRPGRPLRTRPPMLIELRVRDLGVIESVALDLGPGMTALTGETGAGKTLLVEALELLVGGRADPSLVRPGAAEALVEGRFTVDDEEVILARAVPAQGRSRAWIDGRMAPVSALAEAGARLVELHGQHSQQSLLDGAAQRRALDAFAAIDLGPLGEARTRWRSLHAELEALGGDDRARARQADLLRYQLAEIDAAALSDPGENDALADEEDRLAEASAHRDAAATALGALDSGDDGGRAAVDLLGAARAALDGRSPLSVLAGRLASVQADASDVVSELRRVVETWDDDPERLEAVRARRQLLRELSRKYGEGPAGVLAFAAEARTHLAELDAAEDRAAEIRDELDVAEAEVTAAEADVGAARRRAAPKLAAAVEGRLRALAMPHARVEVTVAEPDPGDDVTFLLGANPGEAVLPLAKVASGGELARAMLALRLVLTEAPPTMVFDEVDAGVGGEAAEAVGRALAEVAERHQVLVVTHLAQVAACARQQLGVRKEVTDGRTVAHAAALEDDGRVVELARMLSGRPGSATARRHAEELLGPPGGGDARRARRAR